MLGYGWLRMASLWDPVVRAWNNDACVGREVGSVAFWVGAKYTVCPTHFSISFIVIICCRAVLHQIKVKGKRNHNRENYNLKWSSWWGRGGSVSKQEKPWKPKHAIYMTSLNLHNTLSFFNVFTFNWRIVALQHCVGFCCTSTIITFHGMYVVPI